MFNLSLVLMSSMFTSMVSIGLMLLTWTFMLPSSLIGTRAYPSFGWEDDDWVGSAFAVGSSLRLLAVRSTRHAAITVRTPLMYESNFIKVCIKR